MLVFVFMIFQFFIHFWDFAIFAAVCTLDLNSRLPSMYLCVSSEFRSIEMHFAEPWIIFRYIFAANFYARHVCEAHNLVQHNNERKRRRKENAFKFMFGCMFYKRTKMRSETAEITNWSRIERRGAHNSLTNGLRHLGKLAWRRELLVNSFVPSKLTQRCWEMTGGADRHGRCRHQHRLMHKCMQIIYYMEMRGKKKRKEWITIKTKLS